MPLRVDCEPRVGTGSNARPIKNRDGNSVTEKRWLLGPVEGLIWAILFGIALITILYLAIEPRLSRSSANGLYLPVSVPASTPVPTVQTAPIQQPPAPRWSSREECERYYVLTLHEAPAGRCL